MIEQSRHILHGERFAVLRGEQCLTVLTQAICVGGSTCAPLLTAVDNKPLSFLYYTHVIHFDQHHLTLGMNGGFEDRRREELQRYRVGAQFRLSPVALRASVFDDVPDGEHRHASAGGGLDGYDLEVGAQVVSGSSAPFNVGNAMPLERIPLGTLVHNIEMKPGKGGALARSAGAYGTLTSRDGKYAIIKLPSGESRMVLTTCRATVGIVSNSDHGLEKSGKAGRSRWKGRRPRTRGVAMNPVDHPMGGGEGRASGGHPRSRTGLPAKGYKTRAKKKYSDRYIVEKRKSKK